MRRVLVVFLKDTFFTSPTGGPAQWHSTPDLSELEEVILGSGSLAVFAPDEENGAPQQHLGGRRGHKVAFFPAGGWSGYCWELVDDGQMAAARAQARGIAVPR